MKVLSMLKSLLEIVGLEVMAEGVSADTPMRAGDREFQIVGAVTLKMWVTNEVWTYGTNSRL